MPPALPATGHTLPLVALVALPLFSGLTFWATFFPFILVVAQKVYTVFGAVTCVCLVYSELTGSGVQARVMRKVLHLGSGVQF